MDQTWALTSWSIKAKPSFVISTFLPLEATNLPHSSIVFTPALGSIPLPATRSMPALPTMYPSTLSHCPLAYSSSSATVTSMSLESLAGTPNELCAPPPVSASRKEAANGFVRA